MKLIYLMSVMLFGFQFINAQKLAPTVSNDPLNAQIYTLDNGLTVYLSVNKEEPRIQTFIGVRAGSKDDPSDATGLAHYFEHLMFKGTPNFGTTNWEKEKVLLNQIEELFEVYIRTTDEAERKKIYKQIDEVSFEASKLAIPNEYDKLMKAIGSTGTNAATGNDYTYYVENIPSNQIANWAKVQFDRFSMPILRLFHTELETVYEEKNMSLTNDGRRVNEAMLAALFPNHPYGLQTTLGHPEHLKNPSIKKIKQFFETYYVPNNMAVSMAGDFDPKEVIAILNNTLGKLKPGNPKAFVGQPLPALNGSVAIDVVGLEAENVRIAYRVPKKGSRESTIADLVSDIMSNSKAGLLDVNINQKQLVQGNASAFAWSLNDHGAFVVSARNKEKQSLEEVKDLLMGQIKLLQEGKFDDWLIKASIKNNKLSEVRGLESNRARANKMLMAFLSNQDWKDVVNFYDQMEQLTKKDVVDFANQYLGNNHVVIYKRQGQPNDIPIVEKPSITPIFVNRDAQSEFFKAVASAEVPKIEPQFLDFNKDFQRIKTKNNQTILYKKNDMNELFNLVYYFEFGSSDDNKLTLASRYLDFLGTSKLTADQLKQEFFKIACSFSVNSDQERTYITVSGLAENQYKAIELLENLLADAQPNQEAYQNLVKSILKSRVDAKKNQRSNFAALVNYATYGADSPTTRNLSEDELKSIKPEELVQMIKSLTKHEHQVLYYGPSNTKQLAESVQKLHKVPAKFLPVPKGKPFVIQDTPKNKVLFAHYEGPQSYVQTNSKGMQYDESKSPKISLYNSYFGGGMNAIVFQEMREKRGLAYTARANYQAPNKPDDFYINTSFIVTQNDKVIDALNAFNELFNEIPVSENSFNLAKESLITNIKTNRVTNMSVIWNYLGAKRMGRDYDMRAVMYQEIPKLNMTDVVKFNEQYIKEQPKTYIILGNEKILDFKAIEAQFGPVEKLDTETYFGY